MSALTTQTSCGNPKCTKVHAPKWTRAQVWKSLGEPTAQIGSVNDPRTTQEQGCTWNEKWIYFVPGSNTVSRIVLWRRYDFQGAFRVNADASVEPETLSLR